MAIRQDFILDNDGDFPFEDVYINGVIQPTLYGISDQQHKLDCLFYFNGWLKSDPNDGIGIARFLNSENPLQKVSRLLNIEFSKDGYNVNNGVLNIVKGGGFSIDTSFINAN